LDADYILEGSVRHSGERLRVNALLIATETAKHVWTERYERSIEEIFAIQDEITEIVVSTVAGKILQISTQRAIARSTKNLTAYDYLLRGLDYYKGGFPTQESWTKASELFSRAAEIDPGFARARAWLACSSSVWSDGATEESVRKSLDMVQAAIALDESEPEAQRILGVCYLYLGETKRAERHLKLALRLNPNNAGIVIWNARLYAYTQRGKKAIEVVSRAMRLNPLHPGWYWQVMGLACYSAAKFEDAITALENNPDPSDLDYAYLAASWIALDDVKAAAAAAKKLLALRPTGSSRWYDLNEIFQDPGTKKLFINRLREAGVPE
jgi:adenylate cyclase